MTKGLDKIIVVIAYKNDTTKEVGEDTLILNLWDDFFDNDSFRAELQKVVNALCKMKNFTTAKICAVVFSSTAQVERYIEELKKDFSAVHAGIPFNFEDWDYRFFPNERYIGPFE